MARANRGEQEALALAAFEDLPASQAAAVIGISTAAYKFRLHSARTKLKKTLEELTMFNTDRHSAASRAAAQSAESQEPDWVIELQRRDIRNEVHITEAQRIKAEARLEQIVSAPPSPVSKAAIWGGRVPAKRLVTRLALIPVATAAIIAASIIVPGSTGPAPALLVGLESQVR